MAHAASAGIEAECACQARFRAGEDTTECIVRECSLLCLGVGLAIEFTEPIIDVTPGMHVGIDGRCLPATKIVVESRHIRAWVRSLPKIAEHCVYIRRDIALVVLDARDQTLSILDRGGDLAGIIGHRGRETMITICGKNAAWLVLGYEPSDRIVSIDGIFWRSAIQEVRSTCLVDAAIRIIDRAHSYPAIGVRATACASPVITLCVLCYDARQPIIECHGRRTRRSNIAWPIIVIQSHGHDGKLAVAGDDLAGGQIGERAIRIGNRVEGFVRPMLIGLAAKRVVGPIGYVSVRAGMRVRNAERGWYSAACGRRGGVGPALEFTEGICGLGWILAVIAGQGGKLRIGLARRRAYSGRAGT